MKFRSRLSLTLYYSQHKPTLLQACFIHFLLTIQKPVVSNNFLISSMVCISEVHMQQCFINIIGRKVSHDMNELAQRAFDLSARCASLVIYIFSDHV